MHSTQAQAGRAAVLKGLGALLPPRAVGNEELVLRLGTTDDWIRTRTGIRQRFWADPGTATSELAVEAGTRALRSAGRDRVDAVILATSTPDHPIPGTAPAVAARLGLGSVAAFDVSAVCSGFVYALANGAGLIATGTARSVLARPSTGSSATRRTSASCTPSPTGSGSTGTGSPCTWTGWATPRPPPSRWPSPTARAPGRCGPATGC